MKDHISVCICTFRRNKNLERLLRNVNLQITDDLFDYSVIVVDNDKTGPAREVVDRFRDVLGIQIEYGIEPEPTIPAARNRALDMATGNYIAIIDDDEFPRSNWLITLYQAVLDFEVDGALGPVYPYFEQDPPAWLIRGRFCERPEYRTGTRLAANQTRTGNVLVKRTVFSEHNLRFDMKWKTSGSDRAFFKEAMGIGYRFIAVKEAPVFEEVPPRRWTMSYYFRRALVHGYNAYRNSREDKHGAKSVLIPLKSVIALMIYILALPIAFLIGKHSFVRCLEKGGHHFSGLLAIFGIEMIKKRDF